MKKVKVAVVLIMLISLAVVIAQDDSTNSNQTNSLSTQQSVSPQQDQSKIEKGFECLKNLVKNDCSGAETIQEIALTILASPDDVTEGCKEKLKSLQSSDGSWGGSVRDTGLAILALNHVGEDTENAEKWLLTKNRTATDLIWYLQQDSNEATQCKISYSGNDYTINIGDNKKIDSSAGECLSLARSNFWLRVSPNCYDKEFQISCDKDFISTLLYKQQNSPTIYVLDNTQSAPAFGTINLKINAQCFSGAGGECDYEASAWATLALLKTGHNVENFIPYLIALADSNKKYLPTAFIYIITNYDDYGTQLIKEQKLGNYWEAESTAYNKFYDTGLAILALRDSSADRVVKAKDWLLFSQDSNGCWNSNNIRDTAIILWGLEGRAAPGRNVGVTYCSEANYFCIPEAECPENEKLPNYFCPGLSTVCCMTENLKLCSEYNGVICKEGEVCTGNERKAKDTDSCCLGECVEESTTTECEEMGYICRDSCSENQEEISYSCSGSQVCCRAKTTTQKKSAWWIWLLIIGIIILLILIWIFRARLRLFLFKIKNKFKKEKPGPAPGQMGYPPRPGFPPIRRQPIPMTRPQPKDEKLDNVFKKLKEMSE